MSAYEEGKQAEMRGDDFTMNPYDDDDSKSIEWYEGYVDSFFDGIDFDENDCVMSA